MAQSAVLVEGPSEATMSTEAAARAPSPSVVIGSPSTLAGALQGTVLAADDVHRRVAPTAAEAVALLLAARPDLLVVDERLPEAERLVAAVRMNPVTRPMSVVVVAAGDFDPRDVRFILAGANAILRPPAGPEWDERLEALLHVRPRRDARLAVVVQYQTAIYEEVRSVAGTALNISENGMLLETDEALPLGADVDFRIHLGDGRATPLVGCGQLVRQDAPLRCGVHFYGVEYDGVARLRRFVGA